MIITTILCCASVIFSLGAAWYYKEEADIANRSAAALEKHIRFISTKRVIRNTTRAKLDTLIKRIMNHKYEVRDNKHTVASARNAYAKEILGLFGFEEVK